MHIKFASSGQERTEQAQSILPCSGDCQPLVFQMRSSKSRVKNFTKATQCGCGIKANTLVPYGLHDKLLMLLNAVPEASGSYLKERWIEVNEESS